MPRLQPSRKRVLITLLLAGVWILLKRYTFDPNTRTINVVDAISDLDFTAGPAKREMVGKPLGWLRP